MLLIGSGLLIRSFRALRSVDPGFRADNVMTFRIALPPRYEAPADVARFHYAMLDRIRAVPGVEIAGATGRLPLSPPFAEILKSEVFVSA